MLGSRPLRMVRIGRRFGALAGVGISSVVDLVAPGVGAILSVPVTAALTTLGSFAGQRAHNRARLGTPGERYNALRDELDQAFEIDIKIAARLKGKERNRAEAQAHKRRREALKALSDWHDVQLAALSRQPESPAGETKPMLAAAKKTGVDGHRDGHSAQGDHSPDQILVGDDVRLGQRVADTTQRPDPGVP